MPGSPVTLDDIKAAMKKAEAKPSQGADVIPAAPGQAIPEESPFFTALPQPPQGTLQGSVSQTVGPLEMLAKGAGLGFAAVPEDLFNFGAGVVNQGLGVPVEQRKTAGDLLRMIPGLQDLKTAQEQMTAPQYQQDLNASPLNQAAGGLGSFGGSMLFPLGTILGLGGKAVGAAGKAVPQVAKAASGLSQLKNLAAAQKLAAVPGLTTAAKIAGPGAAYAASFGAGSNYAQTKELPSPEQTAVNALTGGVTSLGLAGLGKMFFGGKPPAPQGPQQPGQGQGSNQLAGILGLGGTGDKTPAEVAAELQRALYAVTSNDLDPKVADGIFKGFRKRYGGLSDEHANAIAKTKQDFLKELKGAAKTEDTRAHQYDLLGKRIEGSKQLVQTREQSATRVASRKSGLKRQENVEKAELTKDVSTHKADLTQKTNEKKQATQLDNSLKIAERRGEISAQQTENRSKVRLAEKQENRQYSQSQTQERRQYQQGQKQENRQYNEGRERQKMGRGTANVNTSGDTYNTIADRINAATSPRELEALERQIYSPGEMNGKRLLDSAQQNNLARNLARRRREISREQAPPPERPPSRPERPQEKPSGKAEGGGPESSPEPSPEEPNASFTLGIFRKMLNRNMMRAQDRHKTAVSAKTAAELAGLNPEETRALKEWSKNLAELALDKKRAQGQLDQLADWALKNPDSWEPSITEFTKKSTANSISLQKAGTLKRLLIQARVEKVLSSEAEAKLATERNSLWEQGVREGKIDPRKQNVNKAHMSATVGGKVEKSGTTPEGLVDVGKVKPMQLPFTPPKNLEELWQRAEVLTGKLKFADEEMKALKAGANEHDLLDDGRTIAELVGRIFRKQSQAWAEAAGDHAKTPAINIAEVVDGHVVTLRYEQAAIRKTFGDRAKDLEAAYKALRAQALAASEREEKKFDFSFTNLRAMTGLEPVIALALGAKKAGSLLGKIKPNALYVGTVRDILNGADPKFGGRQMVEALDNLGGQLLDAFARHSTALHPIKGPEDLTTLLNKFKGVPIGKIMTTKQVDATPEERLTARMIRTAYDNLAKSIKPVLEELNERQKDLKFGKNISRDRLRRYGPDDFKDGKLRSTVYDPLVHDAVRKLHDALKLQGDHADSLTELFGALVGRNNSSTFAGSVKHGIANFADNAPITLAHFGLDWAKAVAKLNSLTGDKRVRGFVDSLPVLPQGDMQLIEREAARANRPPAENNVERVMHFLDDVNHTLGVKWDFLFKGKEKIVNAADRWYTRTATVASVYSQARKLGIPGDELLHGLVENTLPEKVRASVFKNIVGDLSQLYNTVQPHLARDLFATSPLGKAVAAYSSPGRRANRIMYNWLKDGEYGKFAAASVMYIALGGRAVLPPTVRNALVYGAAFGALSKPVIEGYQNLDKMNLLKNLTGWDVSDRISYDALNPAAPVLDTLSALPKKLMSVAKREKTPEAAAAEIMWGVFGSALAVVPKIGPVGTRTVNQAIRNAQFAQSGQKPVHIKTFFGDKTVFIPYNATDALRDSLLAGPNERTQKHQAEQELLQAEKQDAITRALLQKRRSEGSVNLIPSIPKEQ